MGNENTKELSMTQREDIVSALEEKAGEEVPVIASFLNGVPTPTTVEEIIEKSVSQQMQQSVTNFNALFGEAKIVQPPYDPLKLALLLEQNTRLNRACQIRARNTVGLGWDIVAQPYDKTLDEPPNDESVRTERDLIAPLFINPNGKLPFTEVAYREKLDEEATGSGYVEISRNGKGKVDGIYHVPSHTMRVRQGDLGFVQIRGAKRVFFKPFGEERVMNKTSGKYESATKTDRATEIIQFTLYSPRSSYYGIPRWISSVAAIQGSRLAAIRNIAFFENDAVGRLAIVVSGGQLSDKSITGIQDFLRADAKGPEKAHRVMVLQAEPRKVLGSRGAGTGTKIEVVPLTVGITEDGSFLGYRKANDEEVRESSGLSSPYFTSEGINRACLVGDTKIPLLDGSTMTIQDITEKYAEDDFWVYSCDGKNIVPGHAHSPRKMRTNADIVEVMLDHCEVLRTTPDHLFMLRNGMYKEAKDLTPGDRLMPFRQKIPADLKEDNHRVVSVSWVGKADVYDITVDKYNNFATMAGVFVHNSASVLRKITIEQELIPDLKSHEWTWNSTVVDSFGVKDVMLQFARPKVLDTLEEATVHGILQKGGIASINESRKVLGLPPFPDELIFGQLPLPFAMMFLDMGLAAQGMVTPEGPKKWEPQEADDTGTVPDADDDDDTDGADGADDVTNENSRGNAGHRISKDTRGIVESLTGVALSAKKFLKDELGRDVLNAEVVLQNHDGTVIDRVPLSEVVAKK